MNEKDVYELLMGMTPKDKEAWELFRALPEKEKKEALYAIRRLRTYPATVLVDMAI